MAFMESRSKNQAAATDSNFVNPIIPLQPQNPDDPDPDLVIHDGVFCDGRQCQDKSECIQGSRYHCSVCEDVDLCSFCIRDPDHGHSVTHYFLECFARSHFVRSDALPQHERVTINELARQGKVKDISPHLAEIAERDNASKWTERKLPGTVPGDEKPVLDIYTINEKAAVTHTMVPASAQRPTRNFSTDKVVLHHPSRLMDWLTGRLTLYPYKLDQFYEDSIAGIPGTRVIELQPGEGDDPLICSLRPIRLKDGIKYEALSYTWKETAYERLHAPHWNETIQKTYNKMMDCVFPIYVGEDHVVEISAGLRDALFRYRHSEKVQTLWADQICINQRDFSERNYQVSGMAFIYNHASRVVVWTGDEDQYTQSAFELIEQLAHRCKGHQSLLPTPDEVNDDPELDLPPVGAEEWEALVEFFKRPVFGRGWVIQEIVVARDVAVRCGDYETEFWKVGAVATLLVQPDWNTSGFYQKALSQSVRGHVPRPDHVAIIFGLRNDLHSRIKIPLARLLQVTQLFETSDPKDRMFALFNIAGAMSDGLQHKLPSPDYKKPIESICIDVTRYIVTTEQSLHFLAAAGTCRQSLDNLPSWVVDWTVGGKAEYPAVLIEDVPYTAARDSDAMLVFPDEQDSAVLATSSFKCMTVATTGAPKRMPHSEPGLDCLTQWADMAARVGDRYPNDHEVSAAFARTLVGDSTMSWRQSPVSDGYLFYVAALILSAIKKERPEDLPSEDHPIIAGLLSRVRAEMEHSMPTDAGLNNARLQSAIMTTHRCFFVTECGHFGLGPVEMQAGDEVHIIAGGNFPFVLRKVVGSEEDADNDRRTLLGTAYVHGIMNGEALDREDFGWDELLIV